MVSATNSAAQTKERPVKIGSHEIVYRHEGDVLYISPKEQLKAFPKKLTDRLGLYAELHPERTFVAKRNASGEWVRLSYESTMQKAWRIAQSLHNRGDLSAERPLIVLSGNDLSHFLLTTAAMLAGVPFCSVSPAYSLISKDFGKLKHVLETLTPGLVYASNDRVFEPALQACLAVDNSIEIVTDSGHCGEASCTAFESLLDVNLTDIEAHYATLDENTIAKFLFTSGSTKMPKAVPTTHKMLCSNQQMLLQTFPDFSETPPILLDWLSWHHTFGGSHNIGIALYNGGTLYVDDGKPVPGHFEQTIANLKEISPTVYFNVPKGWEELANALEQDAELRDSFFAKVKILFFAGAALSQDIWDRLDEIALKHCGERIRIMCGLGMTETSPSCTFSTGPDIKAGFVGYPAPGCEVKLVPQGGKYEMCVRGPHVMKHYWRLPADQQANVFDEEGFYRTGDAVRLTDPQHPETGLMYDGRIAEDFKLDTGTFVNVGTLRTKTLVLGNHLIQDVCITGSNRSSIGFLIFPKLEMCAAEAGLSLKEHSAEEILAHPTVQAWFAQFLRDFNQDASGSSNRVNKLYLMTRAPQLDIGEITDKGNLNQSNILKHRADLVDELYAAPNDNPLIVRLS